MHSSTRDSQERGQEIQKKHPFFSENFTIEKFA